MSTPLMLEDVILGEIVWGATKSVMAAGIMLVIVVIWGLIPWRAAIVCVPVTFLAGMAFSALGMCFTSLVKNIEMFNFPVFLFVTPMFLFGGVFFPISSLPLWAQKTAAVMPLTCLVSSLRTLALCDTCSLDYFNLLYLAAMTIGCIFFSMAMMRKRILK
ncbi:MAG: ABC transporter permease [Candidatus Omnitrophota bacterium]